MNPKTALLALVAALSFSRAHADPLATAFTYQGRLGSGGSSASGNYDFSFSMWNAAVGPSQVGATLTNSAVVVTNGYFTVNLDFGAGIFDGTARWLEIGVRTNGLGSFVVLSPRQALTAAPYAQYSPTAAVAGGVTAGAITTAMLADGAVTSRKIGTAAVKPSNIDDGGSAAYDSFLGPARSVTSAEPPPFSTLAPVTGDVRGFSFYLDGSALGTVIGFIGREGMSVPYEYIVEVLLEGPELSAPDQLGRLGRVTFSRNSRNTAFAGVVTACALSSYDGRSALYTFRLEPRLALTRLTTDYRVFQNMSVPEVVSSVYESVTSDRLQPQLSGSYPPRDSVIQYGESALNFCSRLLEEAGIAYFFDVSGAPPALVLGDDVRVYRTTQNSPFSYYGDNVPEVPVGAEYIRGFRNATRQSSHSTTIASYDFTRPRSQPAGSSASPHGLGEDYQFGSWATVPADLAQIARNRQEGKEVERSTLVGIANAPDLRPGYTFQLDDRSGAGVANTYLVTSVRHAGFRRMTNGVASFYYGNDFEVIPAAMQFRPAVKTLKPLAQPCIANVTGPTNETRVYVDSNGRVKVQFRWDRSGASDQNSSAWLRVATPMAGATHGTVFLPRIGDEVLVSFIQGDPDQPVITGSLYNGVNFPPYSLPSEKEVSTITSRSLNGGVNELKFDDEEGQQLLSLRGSRDISLNALHDLTIVAGNSLTFSAPGVGIGTAPSQPTPYALQVNGLVGAGSFEGAGSGLSNLSSAALVGTINDALLSPNIPRLNSNQSFSGVNAFLAPVGIGGAAGRDLLNVLGDERLNDFDLFLRRADDLGSGLGWYGLGKPFARANINGPVLYGASGGALGTTANEPRPVLFWNSLGNVGIGTLSPGARLDVAGPVRATSFIGDGAGLTNLTLAGVTGDGSGFTNLMATNLIGVMSASQLPTNAVLQNMDVTFNNIRMNGLLRAGVETGTSQAPNLPVLIRRVNSTYQSVYQVIARTDQLTLERDGTPAGLLVRYSAQPGTQTINALGIGNTNALVPVHVVLNNPGTAGTIPLFTDAQHIAHAQISFGNTYLQGHMTQVILDRFDDGSVHDNYWVGAVISTVNQ